MSYKKKKSYSMPCCIGVGLLGVLIGAFLPDSLSPITLIKNLITKKS